jgi:hypothetical protein
MSQVLSAPQRPDPAAPQQPVDTPQPVDLRRLSRDHGPDVEMSAAATSERLLSALLRQFPVADTLVLGWISLEQHEQAVDLLLHLGSRLANLGRGRVAVMDADDRRKTLTRRCELRRQDGVTELLSGEMLIAHRMVTTTTPHLSLMPAGHRRLDRESLDRAPQLVDSLRREFRFTLVDLGDCLSPLALETAAYCDAVRLFVRLGQTDRALVGERVTTLPELGVPLAGCAVIPSVSDP